MRILLLALALVAGCGVGYPAKLVGVGERCRWNNNGLTGEEWYEIGCKATLECNACIYDTAGPEDGNCVKVCTSDSDCPSGCTCGNSNAFCDDPTGRRACEGPGCWVR